MHDIGRRIDNDHHEKETYNEILKNPEKYGLKTWEAKPVAEICYGHAKESERPIKDIDTSYGLEEVDQPLNLQFLAALLRLADEIDNAFIRVRGIKDQKDSPRKLIRCVNVKSEQWIIEIQSDTISYKDRDDLQNIRDSAQERLEEIKDILKPIPSPLISINFSYYRYFFKYLLN